MYFNFYKIVIPVCLSIFIVGCGTKLTCNDKEYLDQMKNQIRDISVRQVSLMRVNPAVKEAVQNITINFEGISEPTEVSKTEISCKAQVTTIYKRVHDGQLNTSSNPMDYTFALTSNEKGDKQLSYKFDGNRIISNIVSNAKNDDRWSFTWDRFGNSQKKGFDEHTIPQNGQ